MMEMKSTTLEFWKELEEMLKKETFTTEEIRKLLKTDIIDASTSLEEYLLLLELFGLIKQSSEEEWIVINKSMNK